MTGRLLTAIFLVLVAWPLVVQSAPDGPTLTDVERLTLENLALKQRLIHETFRADACAGQLAPILLPQNLATLDRELAAVKARLEAAHPGFTWDWKTQQFQVTPQ